MLTKCAALIGLALHAAAPTPASAQSEQGTIDVVKSDDGRILFVFKPNSNKSTCQNIDTSAITPKKSQRLGQLIFAEALVHKNTVGYVYWLSNANGPMEVHFSAYTWRQCALDEMQSNKKFFQESDKFVQSRLYYSELVHRYSQ
jgi:hypothetical protein